MREPQRPEEVAPRGAKVCASHDIVASSSDADFRDICADVLLSRTNLSIEAFLSRK